MSARGNMQELPQHDGVPVAPSASSFPAYPAAWYLFCSADDLRRGPVSKKLLGRDLVAFRTAAGNHALLDARCSHLGANLGCGEVVGDTLQCPFHQWCYGRDGRCEKIPSQREIPAFARQQSFPVVERHGHVFFFNRDVAFYPLPFFEGERPDRFAAGKLFSYVADASWFMVAAQGFDRQHFETVHDRRLLRPPEISCPSPFVRGNKYHAEIIGESWRDRILRKLVGATVTLSVQNWGGTLYLVKAEFPRACSRFLVSFRSLEDGRTHFDVLVFCPIGWPRLGLVARRWFTQGHLVSEALQVRDTQYRPARLIPADRDMIECFQWLATLPQHMSADSSEMPPQNEINEMTDDGLIAPHRR